MGQIARQPRQEAEFLRMRIGIEVVPDPEIQCHFLAGLPIVLQPTRKEVADDVVPVLRIGGRMENKTGDGGERPGSTGGRGPLERKNRLEMSQTRTEHVTNIDAQHRKHKVTYCMMAVIL